VLQRPVVVSKLRRKRPMCAEEFTYVRARTSHPAKTTMISAQQAAAYYDKEKSASAYPTIDGYLADLVGILCDEVAELIRPWVHLYSNRFPSIRCVARPRAAGGL
jgi:5-methyltetrahydropteroyltriglutamate--homocysteine methyltransferase